MLIEEPKDFIEKSSICIHAVSPDGIIKYANEFELETLDYEYDEYVGHNTSEFQLDKDSLDFMLKKLGSFESFNNYPARVQGKHKVVYILYNSNVFQDGDRFVHTRCFGNVIDKELYDFHKNRSSRQKLQPLLFTRYNRHIRPFRSVSRG